MGFFSVGERSHAEPQRVLKFGRPPNTRSSVKGKVAYLEPGAHCEEEGTEDDGRGGLFVTLLEERAKKADLARGPLV
ncbi:MAG: hypothetical protein ACJAT6_001878 [Akkermansiaceae bacterium]|jgi:hypothetical protein